MNRLASLRIACPNFSAQEKRSVDALLLVLKNFLPTKVELVEGVDGDLFLVNLDDGAPAVALPEDAFVVGCSGTPRKHRAGTIHLPMRPSALLAVVSDFVEQNPERRAVRERSVRVGWSYRLLAWPLDFMERPPEYWRVLAYLNRNRADSARIRRATQLDEATIVECLRWLNDAGVLERSARAEDLKAQEELAETAPPAGWRRLANRMGSLLGFKR